MTTDTEENWAQFKAECFMSEAENDKNKFEQWLTDNEENPKVNACNADDHDSILRRWPGSENVYNKKKPDMARMLQKKEKREID